MEKSPNKLQRILIIIVILIGLVVVLYQNSVKASVANEMSEAFYLQTSGNYDAALSAFTRVIERGGDTEKAYQGRGDTFMLMRQYVLAVNDYSSGLELNRSALILTNRCKAYRMLSDWTRAEDDCTEAIKIQTDYVDAYNTLAGLQFDQNNFAKARTIIQEALQVAPDSASTYYLLGQLEFSLGNYDESIDALSMSINIEPKNPLYYFERGFSYLYNAQINSAKSDMYEVLQYGNPNTQGELLLRAGDVLRTLGENP